MITELMTNKRSQLWKKSIPYWTNELSESLEEVKIKMKHAKTTGLYDDEHEAKHARNLHSRKVKKTIKQYYEKKYTEDRNKFKSIKEMQEEENKTPTHIIHRGNWYTSQQEMAELMFNEFITKVVRMRKNFRGNQYKAINTFKSLIPRVKTTWRMRSVTVADVYEHI